MTNFKKEAYADTTATLSRFYGPNSLACHGIRRLDKTHVESYFIVPPNLCGPHARPPMFDRLHVEEDKVKAETDPNDAREHFLESLVINGVPIKVVPGHNIAGLIVEAMMQSYNRDRQDPVDLALTEFAFIRYRGFILPHQEIVLVGHMIKDAEGITFSPDVTVRGQSRARASKFHLEVVDSVTEATRQSKLDQHWFLETTAQGFGSAVSLGKPVDGKVPVLMQIERSSFAKTPVVAGDLISTCFELLPSPEEQGFGNAEIFVNRMLYGSQRRLMVRFFPIEKIAEQLDTG